MGQKGSFHKQLQNYGLSKENAYSEDLVKMRKLFYMNEKVVSNTTNKFTIHEGFGQPIPAKNSSPRFNHQFYTQLLRNKDIKFNISQSAKFRFDSRRKVTQDLCNWFNIQMSVIEETYGKIENPGIETYIEDLQVVFTGSLKELFH